MRTLFTLLLISCQLGAFALDTEEPSMEKLKKSTGALSEGNVKSVMMIDPKDRASDFIKAFETLRKEISPTKIFFHVAKGSPIANILDVSLMEHGTLMVFRVSSPQGPQYKIVPVEDVLDVTHSN